MSPLASIKPILLTLIALIALAASASAATLQAGESGIPLACLANQVGSSTTTLAGSNVVLVWEPATNPTAKQTRTCAVQADGNSCLYVTSGSDFPPSGLTTQFYYAQCIATYGNGNVLKTPVGTLTVGPSLQ